VGAAAEKKISVIWLVPVLQRLAGDRG